MKRTHRIVSLLLSFALIASTVPAPLYANTDNDNDTDTHKQILIGDIAKGKYTGDNNDRFIKISHPIFPGSTNIHNPKDEPEEHAKEVHVDGLVDYIENTAKEPPYGVVGVPGEDPGANGQGDRGQLYAWASYASGDWMYVCTLYNGMESTTSLLTGHHIDKDRMRDAFGGDLFIEENDKKLSGSTLSKINVKTGEVKF